MKQSEKDRKALQNLIADGAELGRLEALLGKFNIFEAVGMERQEIRHSKFLAFLLDPSETHGMGDAFARTLLRRAATEVPEAVAPVTSTELEAWELVQLSVQTERQHIDIFLVDEQQKLAVIIENKIDAGEHGDQLERYYEAVSKEYPDHRLLALYLTPEGDNPSHPKYLPVSYGSVCEILDELAESQASSTDPDLRILITHYTKMLRRHIVGDSEIARLSREIYHKHQRAIDLIIEHRPDLKVETKSIMDDLVRSEPGLVSTDDERGIRKISFGVRNWDVPPLLLSENAKDKRVLSFQLWNYSLDLELVLFLKPGPKIIRERLFRMVEANPIVFQISRSWGEWTMIFARKLVEKATHDGIDSDAREIEIRSNWSDFLENDLPRIDAALKQEAWIWEFEGSESSSDSRFVWTEGAISFYQQSDEERE